MIVPAVMHDIGERLALLGGSAYAAALAFRRGQAGQTLVEYALLLSMVAVALVSSLILLADQLGGSFQEAADVLADAIEGIDDGADDLPSS